ncbi:hypothetical protein EVG20_g5814 [Dentipellis fragilis]|uniref:Uncharacterized protein n=1 Tax=Dentipellis fragilis TaxID=205917 RepID=A0A4Y9YQJ9_9AGAM|nr:hypothetical protein EVG20_g5814 [Dentipellis fragilis]
MSLVMLQHIVFNVADLPSASCFFLVYFQSSKAIDVSLALLPVALRKPRTTTPDVDVMLPGATIHLLHARIPRGRTPESEY